MASIQTTPSSFPSGFNNVTIRGVPITQSHSGQVFWVSNAPTLTPGCTSGSDGNPGTFQSPLATLNYALNSKVIDGRGDIVFIKPNHKESIPDAATLIFAAGHCAIVGLGVGYSRPTFTFTTATTANIPLRASSMSIQNCLFLANFAAVASVFTGIRGSSATSTITKTTFTAVSAVTGAFYPGMTLAGTGVTPGTYIVAQLTGTASSTGATFQVYPSQTVTSTTITGLTTDFTIENCEFKDLTSALNFVSIVTGNATANSMDGLAFNNNRISSLGTTAATTAIVLSSATDRVQIKSNYGNWAVLNDTAAILATGANNVTNFDFGNNILNRPNTSSTGGSFVSTSATAWTGHAYDNRLWQLDNTAGIWIATGTKLAFSQNFSPITGAADASGLINPAAA